MRGNLKRVIAGMLFAGMIVGTAPAGSVYAEENKAAENTYVESDAETLGTDNAVAETTEAVEEDTEDAAVETEKTEETAAEPDNMVNEKDESAAEADNEESVTENYTVNFVYIESPYVTTPDTQRIVFSFDEEFVDAESVTLTVADAYGNQSEWPAVKETDGLYLFEKDFTGEAYTGTYRAVSVNIYTQAGTEVLDLAEMDIDAEFGVNEEYDGYDELQPVDEEISAEDEALEMSVVTVDEDGVTEAQDSIADALNAVSAQTASAGISTFSRAAKSTTEPRTGNIIIALDPGHDARSTGASGNGLHEEELTLKIANYCKEELEKYAGVEIYMTRTGADCPFQMNGSGCIEKRVNAAADAGAQIFVSFHLNSSTSSSIKGAEVIVQNNNWRPDVAEVSQGLARDILDELVKLGLSERDIYWRNSENGSTYADGSSSDYFSVHRNCKLRNIPGIIIEHAFISNSGDANNFLKTEAGLKSLGVADATGIAKYLGLAKVGERVNVAEGTYTFESALAADKVIGVSNDSQDTGKNIALYGFSNKSSQRFEVISTGDGFYNIVAEHSGKALEVKDGSAEAGAEIRQNTLNSSSKAQKWCFLNAGNGKYYIYSALGTYMDVQSALTSDGTSVWTYTFNGSEAQKWQLNPSDYHPVEDGVYTISSSMNKDMVLNIEGGSEENYANVNLYNNNNSAEQRFEITYVGDGYYKIIAEHSDKSLDVFSALTAPGTNLQQYAWNNSNAQLWKFVDAGNGTYYIRSRLGTVIDLEAGQPLSGANVCMDNMNGEASQKWNVAESDYRPVEDGQYYISNMGSPYNVIYDNNGNIQLGMYTGGKGQLFDISYVDHGYYRITSVTTSKVLDVKNASTAAGADLWTYAWNGSDAQLWKFVENSDGSYQIESKLGTVIDITSGVIVPGTNIQMYTANGSAAQKWNLEKDKDQIDPQPIEDGTYTISNVSGSNQVLDVNSALESDGANVQTYASNNTSAQRFEFHYKGNGYYQILAEHSGKALDVANGSKAAGANVWQYSPNGSDAQLWRILDAGDGTYYIQSKLGTVLDISGNKAVSGSNVQTDYMGTGSAQKWKITASEYRPVKEGMYTIRSAVHPEFTIDIANASLSNKGNAWIYNYNGTPAQRFIIEYADGGYYRITAEHSGKVLEVANGSAASGANVWQNEWNGSDAQLWKFINTGSSYYIRSKLGTVLDISSAVYAAGTNVQVYASNGSGAQKWALQTEYASEEIEEGTYVLRTALDKNKVLDVSNGSTQNGGNIQIYAWNDTSSQKYSVKAVKDGYYKIEAEISGKVLDIANGSRSAGANVWQYEWNGSDAQLWRFIDAGNGSYYLQSKLGTVLDVASGSTASGTNVQAYTLNKTTRQRWTLELQERQLYEIMGDSSVTVKEMADFYEERCTVENQYPYSEVEEAPTIEEFCEIYIDECEKEGVKTEVAFCQGMMETAFLKFGGDVKKEQYNFAGIGAVGNGAEGASFKTIREGIRAQVQHLKAYASTEPLNQEVVDPRFDRVKRGSAIYVEWLGQKENPNGYGWASSENYGYNMVDYYINLLMGK